MLSVMFVFSSCSCGSVGFCCLRLFLSEMSVRMWLGSGFALFCIEPFGMWCLSALSIACVSVVFASCTLVGVGACWIVCSISWVNAGQFAFL